MPISDNIPDNRETISVIIPTYNRAHLASRALRSVLNQSFADFEIMVIDDCSTDDTEDVVKNFKDDRLVYIRHTENKGASAARNTGILAAKGNYIAFLDSDDEWLPDKLKKQMAVFKNATPEVGVVYSGAWIVKNGKKMYFPYSWMKKEGYIYDSVLARNSFAYLQTAIVKKDCFNKVGLLDENLSVIHDVELWFRISKYYSFKFIEEPLVNIYETPRSLFDNTDAIEKDFKLILDKHYTEIGQDRRLLSIHWKHIGHLLLTRGHVIKGRKYLIKALAKYPINIDALIAVLASFLGQKIYNKIHTGSLKIRGWLKLLSTWQL